MKSWKIIVVITLFIAGIVGILYWISLPPGSTLSKLLARWRSPSRNELLYTQGNGPQIANEVHNPTFSITKRPATNNSNVYSIRGTLLTEPKGVDGFYLADFAVEGDTSRTPIKLLLAMGNSQLNFGELDKDKKIIWSNQTVVSVVPKLKPGTTLEVRIVTDLTGDKKLRDTLEPQAEALLKATTITPTTYSIQPQMIAIL